MKKLPSTALVTGAASGIGREVALNCAGRGWTLVCVDINAEGLEATAAEIREKFGTTVHTLVINLAEPDSAEKCLAFCDEHQVEIDFLANVAGLFVFDPLVDASPERVDRLLGVHVYCLTHMCMVFGARMKARRFGYIMNISSMSAWMAMPGINVYNASKSYVRSLSRSLYFELKPWNVSVTAVCPGGISTPLLKISDKHRELGCRLGVLMKPEKLADKAIKATLRKKIQTIPGLQNHFFTFFIRTLPDFMVSFIMKRVPAYDRFWKEQG